MTLLDFIKSRKLNPRNVAFLTAFSLSMVGLVIFYCNFVPSGFLSIKKISLLCAFECAGIYAIYYLVKTERITLDKAFLASLIMLGIASMVANHTGSGEIGLRSIASLLQLVVFGSCAYCAIRITPFGKPAMMAASMLPSTLIAASTLGAQGILYCISILLIAFCFRASTEEAQSIRSLMIIAALAALVTLFKSALSLLVLLVLAIPSRTFRGKSNGTAYKSILIGAILLMSAFVMGCEYDNGQFTVSLDNIASIGWSISHPISLARESLDFLFNNLQDAFFHNLGYYPDTNEGSTEFAFARLISYLCLLLLTFAFLSKQECHHIPRILKHLSMILFFLILIGLFIGGAIREGNAEFVSGMFALNILPIVPLLIPPLTNTSIAREKPSFKTLFFCMLALSAFYFVDLYGYLAFLSTT